MDDGTSEADSSGENTNGGTTYTWYYANSPLVEALANIPVGDSLPSGVSLTYDPANVIPPPYYPNGIGIGDAGGGYASIDTDYGFIENVCANPGKRFSNDYSYVKC